jgi:hypothetical protein
MNPHGMFDTTNPHMYMDIIKPIMAKMESSNMRSTEDLFLILQQKMINELI